MILLTLSTLIFGIILGADPAPMGTIKDAVVLFGISGIIFPPRIIAFVVMMTGAIFIADKFLCSWGCQAGVYQVLLFRLNRNKHFSWKIFMRFMH